MRSGALRAAFYPKTKADSTPVESALWNSPVTKPAFVVFSPHSGRGAGREGTPRGAGFDLNRTVLYGSRMVDDTIPRKGAEEARNRLPDLLDAAENGRSTIITRHGRPVAALVPIGQLGARGEQQSLLPLEGTGRGLWGKNSTKTIRALKAEWER